jgi:hypothetical protein
MRAAGGGAGRKEATALWMWLLLIATACGFVFLLLNLPDHRSRSGPGEPPAPLRSTQSLVVRRLLNVAWAWLLPLLAATATDLSAGLGIIWLVVCRWGADGRGPPVGQGCERPRS